MTKKTLTILLTVVLFLAAVTLGGTTVFRIDDVALRASVVAEDSKAEVLQLKNQLEDFYKDKSIFSVEKEDVSEIMAQYPYLRMTEFAKSYPNKIIISVEEEAEVYAVEGAGEGYYILGATGTILVSRDTSENRLDDAENVVLKGLSVVGEKGGVLSGDDCWDSLFTLCKTMDNSLGGIRSNVVSVEVLVRQPETIYLITMREGIKIYVGNPSAMTKEKAEEAINEYMALSDEQRMTGRLTVRDAEGEIFVVYSPEDEFEY